MQLVLRYFLFVEYLSSVMIIVIISKQYYDSNILCCKPVVKLEAITYSTLLTSIITFKMTVLWNHYGYSISSLLGFCLYKIRLIDTHSKLLIYHWVRVFAVQWILFLLHQVFFSNKWRAPLNYNHASVQCSPDQRLS